MKTIYTVSLSIFLFGFSPDAEAVKTDTPQNYLLPLKEFKGRIDQSVVVNANDDGKPDYILLLKPANPTKSPSQDLLVFISNGASYTQVLNLPSYWDSWGSVSNDSYAQKIALKAIQERICLEDGTVQKILIG